MPCCMGANLYMSSSRTAYWRKGRRRRRHCCRSANEEFMGKNGFVSHVHRKKPKSAGTFPTDGGLFVGLLIGVILIIVGLTFFPALALGPIEEHLAMLAGTLF
jgi:hypothetical protein